MSERSDLWLRIVAPSEEQLVGVTDEAVVGRDYRCDVVVHDEEASRMHARLCPDDDGTWTLADLATTNGTKVNGQRITAAVALHVGDVIVIGRTTCSVVDAPLASEQ